MTKDDVTSVMQRLIKLLDKAGSAAETLEVVGALECLTRLLGVIGKGAAK